jgi:cysteine-rich repeat protein
MTTPRTLLITLALTTLGVGACGSIPNPALLGDESSTGSSGESATTQTAETSESTTAMTDTGTDTSDTGTDTSDTDTESDSGETEGDCPLGTLDCPCDVGESCEPELVCEAGVCKPDPLCGNGMVEGNELCDDGNNEDSDGCEASCSPTRIAQITAGGSHTCVLTESGDVICWGNNANGQLGYGHVQPVGDNEPPGVYGPLPLAEPATAISAGHAHTCAVLDSGRVTCWGANPDGRLGLGHINTIGDNEDIDAIVPLDFGDAIESVTAGSDSTCAHSFVGAAYCWGNNNYGQLGRGNMVPVGSNQTVTNANSTAELGAAVSSMRSGSGHACALMNAGGVRCWGRGSSGQLGYGNTLTVGDDELPSSKVPIFTNDDLIALATGGTHTLIIHPNGGSPQVRGWGSNGNGELGSNSSQNHGDGVGPAYAIPTLLGTPAAIAAGGNHSCAIYEDGDVSCWGRSSDGQLGLSTTQNIGDNEYPSSEPALSFAAPAIQIVAGTSHTCVLLENGDVHCWGANSGGQIGLGYVDTIGDDELATDTDPVSLFD